MALLFAAIVFGDLSLLGIAHLAILAGVALVGVALALVQRRLQRGTKALRLGIGAVLLAETLAWYAYQLVLRQPLFPDHLPLELCDFTLVLDLAVLFTGSEAVFDIAYYLALAGTSMALITPDLWESFPSLATCQFFFAHGLVVASVLYLAGSGQMRPRAGSVGRAMLVLNLWASVAGGFDARFKTNYMYLLRKPPNASLLNLLGPWPWYIAGAEVLALVLFALLYLPFHRGRLGRAG